MAGLFPFTKEVTDDRDDVKLIDMSEQDASDVFSALASKTARRIFIQLDTSPGTASDVAERVDTSVQNVLYHLMCLKEADLIQIVDTWYSSRGVEMKVYAPAYESLVMIAGSKQAVDIVEDAARTAPAD